MDGKYLLDSLFFCVMLKIISSERMTRIYPDKKLNNCQNIKEPRASAFPNGEADAFFETLFKKIQETALAALTYAGLSDTIIS